jgi:large subunit ribosomal protein L25
LVLRGVPKGAADGGVLNQMLHEINIECAPTAVPDRITVDVEGLELNGAIHISEIELPEGVEALAAGTAVVANCTEPRKEEEPEPVEVAEGAAEPEVLSEKKEEGEGEAPGAGAEAKAGEAKKAVEPKNKEGK